MGTSGKSSLALLRALADLPITIVGATVGRSIPRGLPKNVFLAPYLPGGRICRNASLVISNGGSASVYQGLAEGTPVLGIASNMDQFLTMEYVQRSGAGLVMRSGTRHPREFIDHVRTLLEEPSYRRSAERVRDEFSTYNAAQRVPELIESLLQTSDSTKQTRAA